MSLEKRIKQLEETIRNEMDLREWFRSHEWGESRESNVQLGENLDQVLENHDRNIKAYESLLATLRAR
jgi:hypothetical protein